MTSLERSTDEALASGGLDLSRLSPRVRGLVSSRVREHLEWMGYSLESVIGGGAFGVVVRAVERKMKRPVAIKLVSLPLLHRGDLTSTSDELRALTQLRHPHVVPLITAGTIDSRVLYLVMPFIPGYTLRQQLHRHGRFAVPAVLRLGIELADALSALHALDLVHRDLKPDNVLMDGEHAMIIDFGLVSAVRATPSADADAADLPVIGTPAYMSPEQWTSGGALDPRADLYSLGCLLYELLIGVPPYTPTGTEREPNPHLWTESLRTQDDLTRWESPVQPAVPSIREKRPEVPRALVELIEQALEPDRDRRPASALAMREALATAQAHLLSGRAEVAERRSRRAPTVAAVVIAAAAVFMIRAPREVSVPVNSAVLAGTLSAEPKAGLPTRVLIAPVVNGADDPALDPIVDLFSSELAIALTQKQAGSTSGTDSAPVFVPTAVPIAQGTLRTDVVAALEPIARAERAVALLTVVLKGSPERPVAHVQLLETSSGRATVTLPPVPLPVPAPDHPADRAALSRQAAALAAAITQAMSDML